MHRFLFALLLLLGSPAWAQSAHVATSLWGAPAPDGNGYLLALELQPDEGWHTYWRHSGDAGLPTRLRWRLPEQATLQELRWPAPHAYREGPLMTYGFGEAHTLVQRIQLPDGLAGDTPIHLKARYLVCQDICIPESSEHELTVAQLRQPAPEHVTRVRTALQALPETLQQPGQFSAEGGQVKFFLPLPANWREGAEQFWWFPATADLVDHAAPVEWRANAQGLLAIQAAHPELADLDALDGVLVAQHPDHDRAWKITLQTGTLPTQTAPMNGPADSEAALGLWLALLMAFAGGLILNLMPCVFPVLTLKALSLTRAHSDHIRRLESLAYAGGVILSFLLIAGLLLALRAGGAALGWGFQLQNPMVVGALAVLMLIMGLAMLGWTQIGMGMMGAGQNLTQDGGMRGAFFTGVLAVVVASPCSAPFMGGALGYAVLQPAPVALSIFASLGAGLAIPFVLIAWIPALARRLPRPGPWMESLKHWMALPLFLTSLWLLWVLWRQSGNTALGLILLSAALLALGLKQTPSGWQPPKWLARGSAIAGLLLLVSPSQFSMQTPDAQDDLWQPWSTEAVTAAQAQPRMVLVDFTADWCLSCIVNEKAVLADPDIQAQLREHDALLLKADWTQYDPAITAALARFGRNGVPLYLLYPANGGEPEILPQILTTGLVSAAIERAAQ